VEWPVAGFALLESETDPKGARYRALRHFVGGA
jgi:2'-5' RNA ligase